MKKILPYCFIVFMPSLLFSQAIMDSTRNHANLGGTYYRNQYVSSLLNFKRDHSELTFYNDSLHLVKTIQLPTSAPDSLIIHFLFRFKGKLYAKCFIHYHTEYLYEVLPDSLILINQFDMDTVQNTSIVQIDSIDDNTLRLLCWKKTDPNLLFNDRSVIIELDSNFNMKSYRNFNFDNLLGFPHDLIDSYHPINDSIVHIYVGHVFVKYNLNQNHIDTAYYLRGHICNTLKVSPTEYLALGYLRHPREGEDSLTWAPIYGDEAMGFYRMSVDGYPLDTAYFYHGIDSSFQSFNTSFLNINPRAEKGVVDTNNIYLTASATSYPGLNLNDPHGYVWVVKLDSRGNEKWRYQFGGANIGFAINALTLTPDGGCAVFGYYGNNTTKSITAIRIKLGPDGTLNDVEIQAPENAVQFYPNPVKDILHYNYLSPAKGHYQLSVYDMKGTLSGQFELSSGEGELPLNLSPGFYLYDLSDTNKKTIQVGKLVVQ